MATEVATLQFKADTSDLSKASMRLKDVKRSADGAEAANDDYARSNRKVAKETRSNTTSQTKYSAALRKVKSAAKSNVASLGAMAVSFATVGASMKTISIAREFDKINTSLVTMTGSQDAADKAFKRIQNFAATTPFDLAQVANAFVKLKAFGLDPSEKALESYGNTASSMQIELSQMVEAVAGATTGEFERLKALGITTKVQGDKVKFEFRGITKEVGKNAAEIEGYLMQIGLVDFAGGTIRGADTLDGAISNLGDSFDNLFLTISQAGAGQVFEDLARSTTEFLNNLGVMIRLNSDTATTIEQLTAAEEKLLELEEKKANNTADAEFFINNRIKKQREIVDALRVQAQAEKALEAEEKARSENEFAKKRAEQEAEAAAVKLAAQQEIDKKDEEAEKRKKDAAKREAQAVKESAQQQLKDMILLNETSLEQSFRVQDERLNLIKAFREQELIDDEEFSRAKTEIEANGAAERLELLKTDLASRSEAIRLSEENDRLMDEIIAKDKADRAETLNTRLLEAEDLLLKDKSEKQKAGFRLGVNLMNEEKRENAKKIISSSYTAAMDAYKALAGIPVIGPALGAAAFATVLATGFGAATKSLSGRALGGQVRSGESYVVGERGPEVLTMGSSGRIATNESLRGSGGGISIINNVDASGGGADVDQKILSAMQTTSQQTVRQVQDLLRRQRLV